jgi:hypothetical protein|tara:strand:- start:206 stop:838 length:633 start_codon:yes stop_codon:yes gene_type:complete
MASDFFKPGTRPPGPDCTDIAAWGSPSVIVPQYIAKIKVEAEDTYPSNACAPYYYSNAKIDNLLVTNTLGTAGVTKVVGNTGTFTGLVSAGSFSANSKAFDIPHPTRENRRLVHGCLEGPEYGVYTRGRLTNRKEIILPSYWKGLVDWTTISVNLTPIGSHQHLIVKRFDEEKIYLQSNGGMPIDCFYHVYAERMDIPRIEVEPEVDTES